MGCRCSDIRKLNSEINKLNNALKKINTALINSDNTILHMKSAANIFESGVIIGVHHYDLAESIRNKYDEVVKGIEGAYEGVNSALEKAKAELSSAKSEDKSYHERKRNHK